MICLNAILTSLAMSLVLIQRSRVVLPFLSLFQLSFSQEYESLNFDFLGALNSLRYLVPLQAFLMVLLLFFYVKFKIMII